MVVGEAGTGREALEVVQRTRPAVAVLDIDMPEMTGCEVAKELRIRCPETRCVLISEHSEQVSHEVIDFIAGYVPKSQSLSILVDAVRMAAEGVVYLDRAWEHPRNILTPREDDVLRLLACGRRSRDIAATLGISSKTVEAHRAKLLRKLNVKVTADLVRYAIRHHLLEP